MLKKFSKADLEFAKFVMTTRPSFPGCTGRFSSSKISNAVRSLMTRISASLINISISFTNGTVKVDRRSYLLDTADAAHPQIPRPVQIVQPLSFDVAQDRRSVQNVIG
jgi:hypothetical protein